MKDTIRKSIRYIPFIRLYEPRKEKTLNPACGGIVSSNKVK